MKTLISAAICFGYLSAMGQVTTIWMGGYPGQETAWHCPQNWNTHHLPDAFNNVFIPNVSSKSDFYPVINNDAGSINGLTIESGAQLSISKSGSLVVEMAEISLLIGKLENKGKFNMQPQPLELIEGQRAQQALARKAQQYNTVLSATDTFDRH